MHVGVCKCADLFTLAFQNLLSFLSQLPTLATQQVADYYFLFDFLFLLAS